MALTTLPPKFPKAGKKGGYGSIVFLSFTSLCEFLMASVFIIFANLS